MIELTVLRPSGNHLPTLKTVTARYDDEKQHWLCEDATFYRVLKDVQLPDDYYPDEALALVNYVAKAYHGTVKDLRNTTNKPLGPGVVY